MSWRLDFINVIVTWAQLTCFYCDDPFSSGMDTRVCQTYSQCITQCEQYKFINPVAYNTVRAPPPLWISCPERGSVTGYTSHPFSTRQIYTLIIRGFHYRDEPQGSAARGHSSRALMALPIENWFSTCSECQNMTVHCYSLGFTPSVSSFVFKRQCFTDV